MTTTLFVFFLLVFLRAIREKAKLFPVFLLAGLVVSFHTSMLVVGGGLLFILIYALTQAGKGKGRLAFGAFAGIVIPATLTIIIIKLMGYPWSHIIRDFQKPSGILPV